jgi:hypothetical protein
MDNKKMYVVLLVLLIFFNTFDVWSTRAVIGSDFSLEFNPIARGLMYRTGYIGPIIVKAIIMLMMAFAIWKMKTEREYRWVMGTLLIANSFCFGALTSSNLQMLLML